MVQLCVKKLVSNISKISAFELPEMSEGTRYLFSKIYEPLSVEETVLLSSIDFDLFTLDDVDEMRKLYSDVLEANVYKAGTVTYALEKLPPVPLADTTGATTFV